VRDEYTLGSIFERVVQIELSDDVRLLTTRTALNARMRRIDLVCKLAGPLFIALIDGASTKIAIFVTIGINVMSVPIEYFAIAQVRQDSKNKARRLTGIGLQSRTPP